MNSQVAGRSMGRLLAAAGVLLALALAVDTAQAYEIRSFSMTPSTTQAGGHPDLVTQFTIENRFEPQRPDDPAGSNDAKDILIDLPAGVIGNPHAYPICTAAEFALSICPTDSQVGMAQPNACLGPGFCIEIGVPLYSVETAPGQAGLLGFKVLLFNSPVYTILTARTESDYGLVAETLGIQHALPLAGFKQTLWGVPADPAHDMERYADLTGPFPSGVPTPSNSPERPFMQNPTTCGETLTAGIFIRAYNREEAEEQSPYPATTGCGQLSFNPSLSARPTTDQADSPSGLDVDLTVPQSQSPTTPSPSQIRTVEVALPEGVAINPNAADGKVVCTDAEAKLDTRLQALCHEHAKVGLVTINSGVLPGDLEGAIYLGEPKPGNRYRLLIVADGFGLHVKLPGDVRLDPVTGQATVVFDDLPQFPFERFNMRFFGAERGLLVTPERCGTYAVNSTFVPWNAELSTQTATQFFTIGSGPDGSPCPAEPRPFEPGFKAASTRNTAGAHAPAWVQLDRRDGDQALDRVDVAMPEGFTATLRGIPYCPEAAIAQLSSGARTGLVEQVAPACPLASQVGTASTAQGAGANPVHTPGRVFLAGPYKGAPLSLMVVVPAVSGPYDLGIVAVRVAIQVDPRTARITTVSDPITRILDGIPLRIRSILIDLNRPDFALNPTGCSPRRALANVFGAEGALASRVSHFQVAGCAKLGFEPRLSLRLRGSKKRRGHPSLQAVLRPGAGEANLQRAQVLLPSTTLLDNSHIGTVCTRVQFAADACPADSVYGRAVAHTPLLDQPVGGPIYLRASDNKLPDLVADLRGQVDITLAARLDAVRGRLRTTFNGVPDVPVERFVLRMQGGSKGLLVNSRHVCVKPQRAKVDLRAQNRRRMVTQPRYQGCGKGKGGKARKASLSEARTTEEVSR